jgi:hypothetical protein
MEEKANFIGCSENDNDMMHSNRQLFAWIVFCSVAWIFFIVRPTVIVRATVELAAASPTNTEDTEENPQVANKVWRTAPKPKRAVSHSR